MARSAVKHPWDEELQLWTLIFIKKEKQATIPARWGFSDAGKLVDSSADEWANSTEITDHRVRKSKKRFQGIKYPEWHILPQDLRMVHLKYQEYQEQERRLRLQERLPTTPIQEEAWELCGQGNHDWMVLQPKYDGVAFQRTAWIEGLTVFDMRKCYACGYVTILQDDGGAPFFSGSIQGKPDSVPDPDIRIISRNKSNVRPD